VITEGLGERYELAYNMYKPFACGLVVHAAIDGCIQLSKEHDLEGDEIERVDLTVNPIVLELTAKREPATGLEGKFSVFHAAAVAIIKRMAGEAQFSDATVRSQDVISLRRRVEAIGDPSIHKLEARVRVTLRDGNILDKHVERALGSFERPLSDADLETKFRGLVDGVLPDAQANKVIELCWAVGNLEDASVIPLAAAKTSDRA
jgi:2-methylcitrate dehydratase PrpD